MWRRWLCGVIAGGLVLAGCGGDAPLQEAQGADRRQMETAVKGWLAGLADGDGKAACSHLTGDAREELKDEAGASSCEEAVKVTSEQLFLEARNALKSAAVARAFTRGDSGEAEIDADMTFGTPTGAGPVTLEKVDGTWKLAGFTSAGTPANPVGECISGGLQAFEQGPVDPLWKREGRADYRDYLIEVCKRAEKQRLLEDDGEVNRDAVEQIARRVIQRMARRGQIRVPE